MRDIDRPRGGRPRDSDASQRILRATLEIVAENGPARTTIEAVARRAGVGRPTVYRRWPDIAPLVSDAVDMAFAQVGETAGEDDDVATALETLLREKITVLTTTLAGELIRQLAPHIAAEDDLGKALSQAHSHQHATLAPLLERARREGRLNLPSVALAGEAVLGVIYLRLLTEMPPLDPGQAAELAAMAVRPRSGEEPGQEHPCRP
ncbi:TetR/AcrR family transcriptional regulator [Streptosporangium sp. NPDC051023]|uniref:TetR/AcrR family transcriptional regulator n=1 Tax=Streptosporangium sp. NPDC051023 TaxID=3155410 RepID=UPI00344C089F